MHHVSNIVNLFYHPFDVDTAAVEAVVAFDTVDHVAKIWPFTVFAALALCVSKTRLRHVVQATHSG